VLWGQAYAVVIAWTAGSAVRRRQSVAAQQLLANQGNYKANRRGWHPFRVARRSQARICAAGPRLAACRIVCSVIRPTIVEVLTGYAAVARAWEGLLAAAIAAGDGEAAKIGDGDDSAGDGAAAAVAGEGAGAGAADTGDGSAVAVAPFVKSMVPPGTALLGCAATASSVMVKQRACVAPGGTLGSTTPNPERCITSVYMLRGHGSNVWSAGQVIQWCVTRAK